MLKQKKIFQLILASGSPRRKELFCELKIPFKTFPCHFDESCSLSRLDEFLQSIVLSKLEQAKSHQEIPHDSFIVVADTIVCEGEKILGKPKDKAQAIEYLKLLENKDHWVYTGVAMSCVYEGKVHKHYFLEKTRVHFSKMDPYLLDKYLESEDWRDKAGAYGIQGAAGIFVSGIEGCYFNVVGFPLNRFTLELGNWFISLGLSGHWSKYFKEVT